MHNREKEMAPWRGSHRPGCSARLDSRRLRCRKWLGCASARSSASPVGSAPTWGLGPMALVKSAFTTVESTAHATDAANSSKRARARVGDEDGWEFSD